MDIHSLVSTFGSLLHEHTGLGYFVDLLLKSLFVLILLVGVDLFTRRLAASLRHLVWCIGFVCLFFLPLFIGFLPKIQVPIPATETVVAQSLITTDIVSLADNINLVMSVWWNAFVAIYFALLAVQVSYILLGLCKVFSLSRKANPVANRLIHDELENLILEEGLTVSVQLLKSREVYAPVSWGLFSPEIILPEQAEHWERDKIRNVLIHELSHIGRLDWLTTLVVRFTRAIYWFNPLIWYAARKLDEEAEQACDDAVILNGHCQNEYASNLLEIANQARLGSTGNALVQAIAGSFLGSRVFSILDPARKRQKTEVVWVVRGILMGCTVIAILASLRLVPLVNVTSIDPNATTAFSIIFIPKSEASNFGNYVGMLYEQEQENPSRAQDSGESSPVQSDQPPANPDTGKQVAIVDDSQQEGLAKHGQESLLAQTQSETEFQTESGERQPSVLDEYVSASNGPAENKIRLEAYVEEYTSSVTRAVESGISIDCFGEHIDNSQTPEEKARLITLRSSSPEYPRRALQRGLEGYSIVQYDVDSNGKVRDAVIIDSSPGTVFNRTSIRAIQEYLFEPPRVDGEIVSLEGMQTKFIYQLKPG